MTGAYTRAIGRRKEAIAQVRVFKAGTGRFIVNGIPMATYFGVQAYRERALSPLVKLGMQETANVDVKVSGGGKRGQSDAVSLGIARALVTIDAAAKSSLKSERLLTRDARIKERKKPGLHKARRAPQWSKR